MSEEFCGSLGSQQINFTDEMMRLRDRWFKAERREFDSRSRAVQASRNPEENPPEAYEAGLLKKLCEVQLERLASRACRSLVLPNHERSVVVDIERGVVVFSQHKQSPVE